MDLAILALYIVHQSHKLVGHSGVFIIYIRACVRGVQAYGHLVAKRDPSLVGQERLRRLHETAG